MSNILEFLYPLKGSYSGAFVLFWGSMLIVSIGLWTLEFQKAQLSTKLERILFWGFGAVMIIFAALRPIGIARDDLAYLEIYNSVCPTLTCGQWIQGARDWGWYSLVGLLKSWVPDPKVMLWLGAVALLLKLGVIYSLVRRPLLVLLLYVSLYYEVQDLTAWRVSLAVTVFMVAIWLVARLGTYWNAWALFACGIFHKQAFVAPLILVGGVLKQYRWLLVAVCLVPILFIILGIYPELQEIFPQLGVAFQRVAVAQGLDSYIAAKNAGVYIGWRNAPLVVYPQILLMLWLFLKGRLSNGWLESLIAGCLVMGCLFLWGFASLPDAQVRFFEFFMVPAVLLAGSRRLNTLELVGLILVSGIFVFKYNVLHHLLV